MKAISTLLILISLAVLGSSCSYNVSLRNLGNNTYAAETVYKGKYHLSLCTADANGNLGCTLGLPGPGSLNPKGVGFGTVN